MYFWPFISQWNGPLFGTAQGGPPFSTAIPTSPARIAPQATSAHRLALNSATLLCPKRMRNDTAPLYPATRANALRLSSFPRTRGSSARDIGQGPKGGRRRRIPERAVEKYCRYFTAFQVLHFVSIRLMLAVAIMQRKEVIRCLMVQQRGRRGLFASIELLSNGHTFGR